MQRVARVPAAADCAVAPDERERLDVVLERLARAARVRARHAEHARLVEREADFVVRVREHPELGELRAAARTNETARLGAMRDAPFFRSFPFPINAARGVDGGAISVYQIGDAARRG